MSSLPVMQHNSNDKGVKEGEDSKKYYHTPESVEEYIKAAQGYDGGELIRKLMRYLPPDSDSGKSRVLELGSGPGTDFEILCLEGGYHVVGSDLSHEFVKRLVSKFPNDKFLLLDAVTMRSKTATEAGANDDDENSAFYDGLYSNKVLHHLTDDELALSMQRQSDVLRSGGIVCHSFWKGEGTENYGGMFVNNHTEEELRELFDESNFEILLMETYAEFEEGDSILIIGKKK